ncbi:MFS transporter [Bacillus sp. B190/17]|uniref:MFS transporter n=1 Tax=Bacillus lumedeiriae TaxID=3058829 RepID=A0ABW8I6W1_9BACI
MTRAQFVFACLFLTVTSEVLLSPFYPKYFSEAFGVKGVEMTSLFIICCRFVVIIMTPVWGIVLKKWSMQQVVGCSLFMTAVFKALLSESTTFTSFFILSILLLVFQSSFYLLYPYLVGRIEQQEEKMKKTTVYVVVVHTAIIVSSVLGSVVITWDIPLKVYLVFACMDLCMLLVLLVTKLLTSPLAEKDGRTHLKVKAQLIFFYMAAIFFFHLGHHVIRPYFTLFVDDRYEVSNQMNALLYVMPSIMAIVLKCCVPIRIFKDRDILLFYIVTALSAFSLVIQASVENLWIFMISRMLYGACFYLSMVVLDIYLFRQCQEAAAYYYSWFIAVQNVALLFAPLLALTVSKAGFYTPLLCGALLLVAAVIAITIRNRPLVLYKEVKENEG